MPSVELPLTEKLTLAMLSPTRSSYLPLLLVTLVGLAIAACTSTPSNQDAKVERIVEPFHLKRGGKEYLTFGPLTNASRAKVRICLERVDGFVGNVAKPENGFVYVVFDQTDVLGKKLAPLMDPPGPNGPACTEFIGRFFSMRLGRSATIQSSAEEVVGKIEWEVLQ